MKKFNSFLVLSLLMLPSLVSNAQEYLRGDVNSDGHVDISDATCLIDYLLKGSWPDTGNYEYVDLGLPSGTLWATCNVGANCPEEYGDYFAWSETVPKDEFTYENYKWWYFDENGYRYISKYNTKSDFGPVDNKTEMEPEDDAARVNMGTSWCLPSLEQVVELVNTCVWQWTERSGVNGHLVTGPNGNTMFLPAAGYYDGSSLEYVGTYGIYWSRSLYPYLPDRAFLPLLRFAVLGLGRLRPLLWPCYPRSAGIPSTVIHRFIGCSQRRRWFSRKCYASVMRLKEFLEENNGA